MAKTVVGLFAEMAAAEHAVQELTAAGVNHTAISMVTRTVNELSGGDSTKVTVPGIGEVLASGSLADALDAATGGLMGALIGLGMPKEDANIYAESVRRGDTLVTVKTPNDLVDRTVAIIEQAGTVDLDAQSAAWRTSGWTGFNMNATPYTNDELATFKTGRPAAEATTTTTQSTLKDGETVLPVIQEELQVGKRQVQRGGVRVHTTVEETPVEEQVTLHRETVNVERRPVDRPLSDADMTAFKEQSFELTETDEEAVVAKEARVVEEVVVSKDAQDRTETIHETVRRQDVQVDKQDATQSVRATGYDTYDADFRKNFQTTYAKSGATYDQYAPVYRYGYDLASDKQYAGKDWTAFEADARSGWEAHNPGTWEQFKESIHYAWDKARGKR